MVDLDSLGADLYAVIDKHVDDLRAPLVVLAQQWLDRQRGLTGRQRRACSAILIGTIGWRKALAGIPRKQIVEAMGLKTDGAASNQEADRTTAELLRNGLLHRIRGNKRRAHVWWLGWVEEVVAMLDDIDALVLLEEARALGAKSEAAFAARANATDRTDVMRQGESELMRRAQATNATRTNAPPHKASLK